MYMKTEVKKQIGNLQEKINKKFAEDEIEITNEILKLSEDLDSLLNIWNKMCKKEPKARKRIH